MKMNLKSLLACVALSSIFFSCQKDSGIKATVDAIPFDVLNQIKAQGFSTDGIIKQKDGYVVEGDIFLSFNDLAKAPAKVSFMRIAEEEQYRTTNLVTGLPRRIKISTTGLDPIWTIALDSAIARYNLRGLRLIFKRVASATKSDIDLIGADLGTGGVLGRSSGFPDANGNTPDTITINNVPGTFGSNPSVQWLATIVAHEIGHTIGFRHTDYANRNYSCGFSFPKNEGDAGVGAIWIPGTPTSQKDPGSWMLACTDGTNRPFNANDIIALNYLYF
ncbi:hypothetical protein BH10BAC2_BH10BAC2_19440 [soil metagenome]